MENLKEHFLQQLDFCEKRINELMHEEGNIKTAYAKGLNNGMRLVYESQLAYVKDCLKMILI